MNLADIYEGIQTRLATLVTVHALTFEPLNPPTPSVFPILPERGTYHTDLSDNVEVDITVRLIISTADQRASTVEVIRYLDDAGGYSVKAAHETDPTLAGSAESVTVTGWELVSVRYGAVDYLAADFNLNVLA